METARKIRVEIPDLPPKEANPNWRGHWGKRARAVKEFRAMAMYCVLSTMRGPFTTYKKARVEVTLVIPDRRYFRDPDNALASLKPAIDGCADAGVIQGDDQDHLKYKLPIVYQIDRHEAPKTILEFEELKSCPPHVWVIDEHNVGRCRECGAVRDFGALQEREAKASDIAVKRGRGSRKGRHGTRKSSGDSSKS